MLRKVFRARNFLLALVVLVLGDIAWFVYSTNNICGPGEHIIESDADAIKQAKLRISKANYVSHGIPGYRDEKPDLVDFDHTDDCCKATRSRNIYGVIIWKVHLNGETIGEPKKRNVYVWMKLSNCGAVFDDEEPRIDADPPR